MSVDIVNIIQNLQIFRMLGPEPLRDLAEQATLFTLAPGQVLFSQDDPADAMFVVLEGELTVTLRQDGRNLMVGHVDPGDPVGEMQVLTGGRRAATVQAGRPSRLVCLPSEALRAIAERFSAMADLLNRIILKRLRSNQLVFTLLNLFDDISPEQLRDIETRGRWLKVAGGDVLFKEGQKDDNLYLVISGKFRVTCPEENDPERPVAEVGSGETIGEMSMLSGEPRSATVTAIRDCEVVRFSALDFKTLLNRYPKGFFNLTTRVVDRLRQTLRPPSGPCGATNIVLIPAHPSIPMAGIATRLAAALEKHGSTLLLNPQRVDHLLQRPASRTGSRDPFDLTLSAWLDEQERLHRFVLLETDLEQSAWRFRCARRADCILVLTAKAPGREMEGFLSFDGEKTPLITKQRYLVCLWENGSFPALSNRPLLKRMGLERHIHLRKGIDSDLGHLARRLAGKAIGLVLSGGGARALSQIGVIETMERMGIPIDMVGGCSMGAIVGAMHCLGWSPAKMVDACREAFARKNPLSDYTLPKHALLKGKLIETYLREAFGDLLMEDLHKEFFCISSNLRTSRPIVHSQGPLWQALRASLSLPGVLPPVELQGMLLVDGGMLNNLPVDIMKKKGGGFVVAVDVTQPDRPLGRDAQTPGNNHRSLFRSVQKEPSPGIMEVIMRSLCMGGARSIQQNRHLADIYIKLPLGEIGFIEFGALDRLVAMGREHSEPILEQAADIYPIESPRMNGK